MDKIDLSTVSDLELAKINGNLYQTLMQIQNSLVMVAAEIEKRTPKPVKEELVKE